ncbi:VQ motif-containing protein 17 [Sesamum angolense]|uniref:VQ motif-containing protein 17 n=1 Tax=Sesamum angolense TaxID=2727404 RepID=A0AAE1WFL6_9LAMI|nr:VQ motif-containing protein 17 [Sesamum angolense]
MMKRLSAQKTTAAASPAMHNNSQRTTTVSSRRKPKIRIIHIFAPEIIKTDAANFRELVQRLTGNPINTDESRHNICSRKKIRSRSRMVPTRQEPRIFVSNGKQELGVTSECAGFREMRNTKGDDREEVWRGGGNTVFAEFDEIDEGFMQEIDDHHDDGFPFMESTTDLMDMSMGDTTCLNINQTYIYVEV